MALTTQLELILKEMNAGKYLIRMEDGESLSTSGYNCSTNVKKGSIEALLKEGLIFRSAFTSKAKVERYLLTDDGRKFRKIEY